MLTSLRVRDLATIESIDLEFADGLTVLTGETGTGKSILLDALGLVTGRRADAALVRPGAKNATVSATFSVGSGHAACQLLESHGLDALDDVVVRRLVRADGRSQAFVNDMPVSVGLLSNFGELLVEMLGQDDQRGLFRTANHRTLLDLFGNHGDACRAVRESYAFWQASCATLTDLEQQTLSAAERREAVDQDLSSIVALSPAGDEDLVLAARRSRLVNARKIADAIATATEASDRSATMVQGALRALESVQDVAGDVLNEQIAALERALIEITGAESDLVRAGNDLDSDPETLEEIEDRLFALRALARRFQVDVAELPAIQAELEKELAGLTGLDGSLARAAEEEKQARQEFERNCVALTRLRKKSARDLDLAVQAELEPLRMSHAHFQTCLENLPDESRTGNGAETVAFRVVTSHGAEPGPLHRIASGGELSRFMLAIRVAGRRNDGAPTIVFDEIDAGIGGAVSDAVGERLWRLGRAAQVMVVTHAPQIAARADNHIAVRKLTDDTAFRTVADPLNQSGRREELARMLAGAEVTEAARTAADSLLKATGE